MHTDDLKKNFPPLKNLKIKKKLDSYTLSGRLLTAAICEIGKLDVFEARTQWAGIYYIKINIFFTKKRFEKNIK